jgi:hypothetical protein
VIWGPAGWAALTAFVTGLPSNGLAAEAPAGRFRCEGVNPDGKSAYAGQVTVLKTGDTYQIQWKVGPTHYLGTGVMQGGAFAVAYMTPKKDWMGVALYQKQGPSWFGVWAQAGTQVKGLEKWTQAR